MPDPGTCDPFTTDEDLAWWVTTETTPSGWKVMHSGFSESGTVQTTVTHPTRPLVSFSFMWTDR